MVAAGRRSGVGRRRAAMGAYGVASLALIGLYPFLPQFWRGIDQLVVFIATAACVGFGRHAVVAARRKPWTLLLCALGVFVAGHVVLERAGERAATVGRLLDATGYVLLFAAALAFIVWHGAADLGGVVDAAVIALAVGSVLWFALPHRLGRETHMAAQIDLFVVVFALSGVLGALLRLTRMAAESTTALWWLLAAITLVISGDVVASLAGSSAAGYDSAIMLLMAALTATGLFGLDPTAPRLVHTKVESRERLSSRRLLFLGVAVAAISVVVSARGMLSGNTGVLMLALQGIVITAVVMGRIGLLSSQRDAAERRLEHLATHDSLTNLPNRAQLVGQLHEALGRDRRCALLYCDLNRFKDFNDRYGHEAGDRLLVDVAKRLAACAGQAHAVSRHGGDEFLVLLVDADPSQVEAVRNCILTQLRSLEHAGGTGVEMTIGVAYSDGQPDPERLISSADQAMFRAKPSAARRQRQRT